MGDRADLRRRLERVGRRRPVRPTTPERTSRLVSGLPAGEEIPTSQGSAYRIESEFALDHEHGRWPLHAALSYDPHLAARVAQRSDPEGLLPERLGFLDTETTGLAGGAGTLVFLVGIGRFVGDRFRLRQYFLRDPAEEAAMLLALQDDLEPVDGFVTFNGQRFDLPLLEMRYTTGLRRRWRLTEQPQLDLLFPARRLWRRSLPDCTLSTLESELLGVRRTEEDIPGWEIPGLYLDYLRSGETEGIHRIVYHNRQDILSLVGLAAHVLDRHSMDAGGVTELEALALARWYVRTGDSAEAESYFLAALESADPGTRREALRGYTALLKGTGRRAEAIPAWGEWGDLAPDDPTPATELAKYYEWQARDLLEASRWAERALLCLESWPDDWRRRSAADEIEHRLARLHRKIGDR
jgi:uncharacterized protein YprB with RNaseH-like and TPR domain